MSCRWTTIWPRKWNPDTAGRSLVRRRLLAALCGTVPVSPSPGASAVAHYVHGSYGSLAGFTARSGPLSKARKGSRAVER
jgi:hypothetical protein